MTLRTPGTLLRRRAGRALGAAALAAAVLAPAAPAAVAAAVAQDAGRGTVHRAAEDGGWEEGGLRLDAGQNEAVDAFLDEAEEAERLISPQMIMIAERTAAELVGFGHRLKSESSLKRKVATWLQETPEKSVEEVLDEINDSVRYTLQWDDAEYTDGVARAADLLAAWQHSSVRWSNTWANERGYKAVNSAWREPLTGHVFEVQFHTPASHAAAVLTHPLYEEQRLPSTPPERVAELREQQGQIFAAVPVPAGAEALRAPRLPVPAAA